jgi:hypothetical protein
VFPSDEKPGIGFLLLREDRKKEKEPQSAEDRPIATVAIRM